MVMLPAFGAAFAATVSMLVAVDLVSWRRTSAVRTGRAPSGQPAMRAPPSSWPRGPQRTSLFTFLAGTAGLLAVAWGLAAVAAGWMEAAAVAGGGAFVAASGLRSRVSGLDVRGAGLRIRYAARPQVFCSWDSVRSLVPPRTPLGAWRLNTSVGGASLMPSDLSGHEHVLHVVITLAALKFQGRSWARSPSGPRHRDRPDVR